MSSLATVARPYAKAIAQLAEASGEWDHWESVLGALSALAQDKDLQARFANPKLSADALKKSVVEAFKKYATPETTRLLDLLVDCKRLDAGGQILAQFCQFKDDALNQAQVDVRSAVKLTEAGKKNIIEVMEKRLNRKVSLSCHIDPSLHAGVVIRYGDEVINATVAGRLERLARTLRRV